MTKTSMLKSTHPNSLRIVWVINFKNGFIIVNSFQQILIYQILLGIVWVINLQEISYTMQGSILSGGQIFLMQ